ncbi:MAG TPA: PH domain-containing protein [Myxococcales bacterium]|nr:PH domain-containing protein [Myxococcales bacterium]
MLNRHAIVLTLGLGVVFVLVGAPEVGLSQMGTGVLVSVVGLLLDDGLSPRRIAAGHLLELYGAVALAVAAGRQLSSGVPWTLPAAELGISLALLGLLLEMRLPYARLRAAVAVHALGDALFVAGFVAGVLRRALAPSLVGWVGVGIAAAVSLYAAVVNLGLQLARLRDARAGWRYRVLEVGADGLTVRTLSGSVMVPWAQVQAVRSLDARHLVVVLPSPLPEALVKAELPVEELRESDEPPAGEQPPAPEKYALVLHEQELGSTIPEAEARLRPFVRAS